MLPNDKGDVPFNCDRCPFPTEDEKRAQHCAFIPRRTWLPLYQGPPTLGAPPGEPECVKWGDAGIDVCPGAALKHPLIHEVVTAKEAMTGGAWSDFVQWPTRALLEGVMRLKAAFNRLESQQLRKKSTPAPLAQIPRMR